MHEKITYEVAKFKGEFEALKSSNAKDLIAHRHMIQQNTEKIKSNKDELTE